MIILYQGTEAILKVLGANFKWMSFRTFKVMETTSGSLVFKAIEEDAMYCLAHGHWLSLEITVVS